MTVAEVMLVRWPEDGEEGTALAHRGVAVLYVVAGDAEPPPIGSCLEDWVRVPGDEADLQARIAALEARSAAHVAPPRLDDDGRFRHCGQVVLLSADLAQIARPLVERFGEVVLDQDLAAMAPDDLRRRMARLRAKLRALDLRVPRVQRRGYRLETV